jgi:hypothetical protein
MFGFCRAARRNVLYRQGIVLQCSESDRSAATKECAAALVDLVVDVDSRTGVA